MTWITGPNGAVVGLSDDVAKSIVGDGSRGYTLAPESAAKHEEPEKKPAPRKRAPRKPKADSAE
jgi:hypothetical protein